MKITRKCATCKQERRVEEMIQYTSLSGKTTYWYCPKCYEEKVSRDNFSTRVCALFGISTPGPQIWTERKRLREKYGFSDEEIIDTLDYLVRVEHKKILSESLYLVTPVNVLHMKDYKRKENNRLESLTNTLTTQTIELEKLTPTIKKEKSNIKTYSLDDWV